jgi:signal transduction histidine kinase
LAQRVGQIEPGTGQRVALHAAATEIAVVSERFDELVARFDEALEREKRFAAEASHELRTPLTLALAEIEALQQGGSDSHGVARAAAALSRLSALVDALLWFARSQSRVDDERMEIVNLADVIVAQVLELRKTRPGVELITDLPEEALVRGDETLITRVLANLLDNALKYGGGTCVEVQLTREASWATLSVTNGGEQIPAAARQQIFTPFFRARADKQSVPGFGLGLPFVRAVARAHGGDVELAPTTRGSTRLLLRLPWVDWNDGRA